MDRKATARQTLEILKNGCYEYDNTVVDIRVLQKSSESGSILYTPEEAASLLEQYPAREGKTAACRFHVSNRSTVDVILEACQSGFQDIGVLNFASAKNPGGGFLNGAMAQEESLAASSGLYRTLTRHEAYYQANRACGAMIYTDHAIYSPEVVFFRDGSFRLLPAPVTASVLTLPAVNMGQVLLKGEDKGAAENAMYRRMKAALAIFAAQGRRSLILGAYGCGVFRNDPRQVAGWWKDLLDTCFPDSFDRVLFAVLDRSARQECLRAFTEAFPEAGASFPPASPAGPPLSAPAPAHPQAHPG